MNTARTQRDEDRFVFPLWQRVQAGGLPEFKQVVVTAANTGFRQGFIAGAIATGVVLFLVLWVG